MERLSLEELKAKKAGQVKGNLEAIKGGKETECHRIADIYPLIIIWF